jgi:hypothetical protein
MLDPRRGSPESRIEFLSSDSFSDFLADSGRKIPHSKGLRRVVGREILFRLDLSAQSSSERGYSSGAVISRNGFSKSGFLKMDVFANKLFMSFRMGYFGTFWRILARFSQG